MSLCSLRTWLKGQDGRKKGKNAGNAQVGEKIYSDSNDDSDDDDDSYDDLASPKDAAHTDGSNLGERAEGKHEHGQGTQSADIVIAGEQINHEGELSEKKKKKIAQAAAKKKRDELVAKMTKGTQDGLGAAADMIERFTKSVPTVREISALPLIQIAPCLPRHATPTNSLDSRWLAHSSSLPH